MTAKERLRLFRCFTSVVAMGFLLWTLSSSTFLDASTAFVAKKLDSVKKLNDSTAQQVSLLAQHFMR